MGFLSCAVVEHGGMTFLRSWGLPVALSFLLSASALAMYQKMGVELGNTECLMNGLFLCLWFFFPLRLEGKKHGAIVVGLLGLWLALAPLLIPLLPWGSSVLLSLPLAVVARIGFSVAPAKGFTCAAWLAGCFFGIALGGMLGLSLLGSTQLLWGLGALCLSSSLIALYRWRHLPGSWLPAWSWLIGVFAATSVLFALLPSGVGIIASVPLFAVVAALLWWKGRKTELPPTLIVPCITIYGIGIAVLDAVRMLDCLAQRPPLWVPGFLLLAVVMFAIGLLVSSFLLTRKQKIQAFLVPAAFLGLFLWALAILVPWGMWNSIAMSLGTTSFTIIFAWICSLGFLGLGLVCLRSTTLPQWQISLPLLCLALFGLHRIFPGWIGNVLLSLFMFAVIFGLLFFSGSPWKKVLAVLPFTTLLALYLLLPAWPKGMENSIWTPEGLVGTLDNGYRLNRSQVGAEEKSGASMLLHLPFLLSPRPSATVGLIAFTPPTKIAKSDRLELTAKLSSPNIQISGIRMPRPWLRDHPATFDVLIVSPDEDRRPEVLAGADGLAILKNSLSDQGVLCFLFPITRLSVKELQARVAGFVKVFPSSCSLWTQGGFLALIGSKRDTPLKIDPRRWEAALKNEAIHQDLSWSDFGGEGSYLSRPENFFAGFLCGPESLRFMSRNVKPLSGDVTPASRPHEAPVEPLIKILAEHLDQIDLAFHGAPPAWTSQAEEHRSRYLLPEMLANRTLLNAQRQEMWGYGSQADTLRENATRQNPRNLIARALVGRTMVLSGRLKEAREILEAVLIEDRKQFQALMFMATLSMMEKDPAKADDYLAKAVISAPKNSQALMTLAQMRLGAGKNAEALKLAQRAAAISPEDPQVQHTLAQALVANGDKTQAITLWRGLLKDPSLSPELLITIANTIQTLDPGLGLAFVNRCHAMSPENPWTMLMLARLQFLNKQTDQAKKNCAEAKRQAQSLGDARLLKACESLEMELLGKKP